MGENIPFSAIADPSVNRNIRRHNDRETRARYAMQSDAIQEARVRLSNILEHPEPLPSQLFDAVEELVFAWVRFAHVNGGL